MPRSKEFPAFVGNDSAELAEGMSSESRPSAPDHDRPIAKSSTVDAIVLVLLLALACLLGWDSVRVGNAWADDGPQAGYFPFYLSILMGAACLFGLGRLVAASGAPAQDFITRRQFDRVMQVFVPTLAFVLATGFLGLYVASFLLVAGFMWWIGSMALWKSLLTGFLFAAAMFLTFEIAFNVIMPKGPLEAAFGF
jgi:putative tricarboxylic transport membrane protein